MVKIENWFFACVNLFINCMEIYEKCISYILFYYYCYGQGTICTIIFLDISFECLVIQRLF